MPSPRHQFILILWRILPALSVIAALLLTQALAQAAFLHGVIPALSIPVLFYWCVHAPDKLPYFLLFTLGMASDALIGTPFGLSALLWMLLKRVIGTFHEEIKEAGFIVAWAFFAASLLIYYLIEWASMQLFAGSSGLPAVLPMHFSLTIMLYPSLHRALSYTSHQLYRKIWFSVSV